MGPTGLEERLRRATFSRCGPKFDAIQAQLAQHPRRHNRPMARLALGVAAAWVLAWLVQTGVEQGLEALVPPPTATVLTAQDRGSAIAVEERAFLGQLVADGWLQLQTLGPPEVTSPEPGSAEKTVGRLDHV